VPLPTHFRHLEDSEVSSLTLAGDAALLQRQTICIAYLEPHRLPHDVSCCIVAAVGVPAEEGDGPLLRGLSFLFLLGAILEEKLLQQKGVDACGLRRKRKTLFIDFLLSLARRAVRAA